MSAPLSSERRQLLTGFSLALTSLKDWEYLLGSHYHRQMNSQPLCGPLGSSGPKNDAEDLSSVSHSGRIDATILILCDCSDKIRRDRGQDTK